MQLGRQAHAHEIQALEMVGDGRKTKKNKKDHRNNDLRSRSTDVTVEDIKRAYETGDEVCLHFILTDTLDHLIRYI